MSVSQRKDGRWLVKFKQNGKWVQKAFRDEGTGRAFDAEQVDPEQDTRLSLMELMVSFFQAHPDYHHETKRKIIHFINGYTNAAGASHPPLSPPTYPCASSTYTEPAGQ